MKLHGYLLLLLPFVCFSCTMPRTETPLSTQVTAQEGVQRLQLRSLWQSRYTGLIAIRRNDETLHFTLLDPTGLTLLSGEIGTDGTHRILSGITKLTKGPLPSVLARGLWRIYLQQPPQSNCSTFTWQALCIKELDESRRMKYSRSGPLLRWQSTVDQATGNIRYDEPWTGFSILLSPLNKPQR